MGKSIDGMAKRVRSMGSQIALAPRPIPSMSLQPAIPWRVALQQSPTPLHRLSTMLKEKQHLEKTITLNGNCVLRRLSHSRGSPQLRAYLSVHNGRRVQKLTRNKPIYVYTAIDPSFQQCSPGFQHGLTGELHALRVQAARRRLHIALESKQSGSSTVVVAAPSGPAGGVAGPLGSN